MSDFYVTADALVYSGALPAHIAPFLPDAQRSANFFAVPRTLRNSIILAQYNYPVAPVMTDDNYDWPIEPGKKPLAHQKMFANFTVLHPKMFNLGDPGTMKTISTLWAMDFMMRQFEPGTCRALVVGKLSTLETVWAANIFRNFPGRFKFKVLIGDADKRERLLAEPADIYVLNHDGVKIGAQIKKRNYKIGEERIVLRGFSEALAARKDIKIIIPDEASAYKDSTTFRHAITRKVLGDRPFCWLLTGSPTPNRPSDAFGLAKFVNNAFGKSLTGFRLESEIKVSEHKWVPQKDGYDKARRLLTPSIRYALRDVWDGPRMTIQRRKVELTPEQKTELARLKRDLEVFTKSGKSIPAQNEAAARQKFIQISLGMIYDEDHKAHVIDASPRYAELYDLINNAQRKVLVFVTITAAIHLMTQYVQKHWKADKLPWRCDFINGEVPVKKRAPIIKAFESDDKFKVCFADPEAAGHGINEFVAADTVIWASATDKAEHWQQGNGRVERPGQNYPSTCYQIVSNALEEDIFDRLEQKSGMQGAMLKAIRNGVF